MHITTIRYPFHAADPTVTVQKTPSKVSSKGDFFALDLLRASAALIVLFAHVRGASFPAYASLAPSEKGIATAIFYAVTRPGYAAVMIFFILSGFLVGGQVIRRIQESRFDLIDYSIDRATRIFLPLVPALICTAILSEIVGGKEVSVATIAAHIAGLNGVLVSTVEYNGPLWSLAYEIWFYVLMGCVAFLFTRQKMNVGAIAALGMGTLVFCTLDATYLLFWLLGAIAASFPAHDGPAKTIMGWITLLVGIAMTELTSPGAPLAAVGAFSQKEGATLLCLGLVAILPSLCHARANSTLRPFVLVIRAFSRMSYSIYIFHYPILLWLTEYYFPASQDIGLGAFGSFAMKIALCIISCAIFYLCFERWTVPVRVTIRRWMGRKPATV